MSYKNTALSHATNMMLDAERDGNVLAAVWWSGRRAVMLDREIRRGRILGTDPGTPDSEDRSSTTL